MCVPTLCNTILYYKYNVIHVRPRGCALLLLAAADDEMMIYDEVLLLWWWSGGTPVLVLLLLVVLVPKLVVFLLPAFRIICQALSFKREISAHPSVFRVWCHRTHTPPDTPIHPTILFMIIAFERRKL
jgi:hypothetical protein